MWNNLLLDKNYPLESIDPIQIAIFASGGGSNAAKITEYFSGSDLAKISLFCTNNSRSGVIALGAAHQIPVHLLEKSHVSDGLFLCDLMATHCIDLVVLAGYLRKIPTEMVERFPGRILNIHPALLPDFGGQGMYGIHVHQAVLAAGRKVSGTTVHFVNEVYDQGEILFQQALEIDPRWTAEDLQEAVKKLEHQFFPKVIEKLCQRIIS